MCVSVYEEGDKKGGGGGGGGEGGGGGGGGGGGSGIIATHTVHIQCVKTAANILRQASKLHKLQDERWGHKLKTRHRKLTEHRWNNFQHLGKLKRTVIIIKDAHNQSWMMQRK